MNIIDTFFYCTYRFLMKLGRSEDNAKWSALMHASLYVCLLVDSMIKLVGLIHNDSIIKLYALLGFWGLLPIDLIAMIILYIRYYKYSILERFNDRYKRLKSKNLVKILVCMLMICFPLLWFYITRTYISVYV
ncbi:MAG: hypothetical protein H6Q15_2322 [Bacteroidetes bacterium]|nr:hypothetical protein [Bacteroidota bacterium]